MSATADRARWRPEEHWAVEVDHVTKRYRLGQIGLRRLARRLAGRPSNPGDLEFDALADMSLTIPSGGAFGLVGGNGSGKSTLLQIIAGITLPTRGVVTVRGSVLPLMAVGSGFHYELTGRENVTLQGAILGLSRSAIAERMDAIVEFAGVERHVDTPAKRFSTGMLARLSFATAVLFPADIYIFDEVLAVVDGDFRDRCIEEIQRLATSGSTVLFVSHDASQVRALCENVAWMDGGKVRKCGPTHDIMDEYEHLAVTV